MSIDASVWATRELHLRLILDGEVRTRAAWSEELDALCRNGWAYRIDRSGRRVAPRAEALPDIEVRLERLAPGLLSVARSLREAGGNPYDPDAYRIARRGEVLRMPAKVSRKVASATLGRHSKAALSPEVLEKHGIDALLGDGCLRFRCASDLRAQGPRGVLDIGAVAEIAGEASLPERFLNEIDRLDGTPRLAITVENAGAFLEMPIPEGAIMILAPGSDTVLAGRFVAKLAPGIPLVHFGDFDPRGLEAAERMARAAPGRRFAWLLPPFLDDYALTHWLRLADVTWPARAAGIRSLNTLVKAGCWMEQEAMVLDVRLPDAIEAAAFKDSNNSGTLSSETGFI
jgi:hypothetical protein